MAGTFDPTQITFNGKENQQLNEGVFESVYELPSLNEFHEIRTGIKAKEQIAIFGLLGMVGTKGGNDCSTTVDTNQITASEKFWDPKQIDVRLTQCVKDILPSFIAWGTKNGIEKNDLTASAWMMFVQERLTFAMEEAMLRHIWFGDTDAALTTDSPAGVITASLGASGLAYFNAIDGFWKQIFDIVTADDARRYTISENAEASYTAQLNLSAGKAKTVWRELEKGADIRLRKQPDKIYITTQSLYDEYADYLEDQSVDASFVRLESGFEALKYRGTLIIPFDFWDRNIQANEDNGTTYYRPHRALLTVPENLQVGLEDETAYKSFLVWYEKKEKTNYIDVEFSVDAKVIHSYLVQAAY